MSATDLISYRARASDDGIVIVQTGTSLQDAQQAKSWQWRLEPWVKTGHPQGSACLDFGSQAAVIRWQPDPEGLLPWRSARARVGDSAALTGLRALELLAPDEPGATPDGGGVPLAGKEPGQWRAVVEARSRSADAIAALIPLLAHVLRGEQRVTMPWVGPGLPEAVMWGFLRIAGMLGDKRPVSFLAHGSLPSREREVPGLLVTFRPDATAPLPPDQGFAALAADLADRYAADPAALGQALTEHGLPNAADQHDRISRLLSLPPRSQPGNAYRGGTTTVTTPGGWASRADDAEPELMCPICLGDIENWDTLPYWRWDDVQGDYVTINIPSGASKVQRARLTHAAYVRCPHSDEAEVAHYLPARYGQFGEPVLLGFVGVTQSGKTHLLASMIGGIGDLMRYGVSVQPLDQATHQRFWEKAVRPLIADDEVLPGTPDDASTTLADAFIVQHGNGPERVVALFDVSGGNLAQSGEGKEFLWITNGLFFVVDPGNLDSSKAGDVTFSNVLGIVRKRDDAAVSAAIVLNKADKKRFDEPVARWLRTADGTLDPVEFLRESADVYAYIEDRAPALTEPYRACEKATLHVASPTGGAGDDEGEGSKFPRGVTPQRVLRPLVAMLAMTGVITGRQAEEIGV